MTGSAQDHDVCCYVMEEMSYGKADLVESHTEEDSQEFCGLKDREKPSTLEKN